MKKCKNMNKIEEIERQNPVAKFASQFNKAKVFDDKSKYNRKEKHAKQEASPVVPSESLEKFFAKTNTG